MRIRTVSCLLLSSLLERSNGFSAGVNKATSFTGTSPAEVDMNAYNLPLDQIAQEWTATVVPESALRESGIYLGAKSVKEIMVDSVKISFPRKVGQGLGIQLLEIAGGRADGLGITVVEGIVEGGSAQGSGIMMGDSISKVEVRKIRRSSGGEGLSDFEEVEAVDIECFGYDKTIEAIMSLPAHQESEDECIMVTVKRLRRKPKVLVTLQYPPYEKEADLTIELFAGENLRRAMLTRGVKLNDLLSRRFDSGGTGDCGAEGTCATCVVSVVQGEHLLNPAKQQEQQIFQNNPRYRLACKAIVGYGLREGEMTIRVNPRQWDDSKQR
jgi:ferredoxin